MQDFSRQVAIAIRWLPLILVCAIASGGLAFAFFSGQPKVYESTAQLVVRPGTGATLQDLAVAADAASKYARDAASLAVARVMTEELGLDESPRDFMERVSTDVDAESLIVSLSVRDGDPQEARRFAQVLGRELIARVRSELTTTEVRAADAAIARAERFIREANRQRNNLQRQSNRDFEQQLLLQNLRDSILGWEESISRYRSQSSSSVRNLIQWFEQPTVPVSPVEPRPLYWTLLALVAGGILGAVIAFVAEYLRRVNKVRDERDLELATGQPALGSILEPKGDRRRGAGERLVMMRYPRSDGAEAYRDVIARMGFSGGPARSLAITSAKPADAKGLIAANVALAYAEAGRNVILVDADYRAPRIHSFFGVSNDRGLTTILTDSSVPLGWATVPTAHPRLGLMPSGPMPRETAEPLGDRQLNALLRRLLQAADLVIVHSPAMHGRLDAAVLAEQLDGVLLVVPHDSKADETEEAARSLQQAEAEFVGAVLYRTIRRARKGARVQIAPAPDGWGPTWPGLYDAPAQIPAVSQVEHRAQQPRAATVPATASMQVAPPPFAPSGHASATHASATPASATPASGPFAVPFKPEGITTHGSPAPTQQPVPGQAAAPDPRTLPTVATAPAATPASAPGEQHPAPASTVPAPARPLQAVGPGAASDSQVGPNAPPPPAAALPFAGTFQAAPLTRMVPDQPGPPPPPIPTPVTPSASSPQPSRVERNGNGVAPTSGHAAGAPATVPAPPNVAAPSTSGGSSP